VDLLDLGPRRLRDVPNPITVFQLQAPGLRTDFPALRGVDSKLGLLRRARDAQVRRRMLLTATCAYIGIVELTAQAGEVRGAIESARRIVDQLFETGEMFLRGFATAVLVELLLRRGS